MTEKVIPGTVLPYSGIDSSVFSYFMPIIKATDGLTLGQVCSITGLEASTVQNWVKRGFVPHPVNRKYCERHFARILLISALRDSMRLENIGELLTYINGDTEDTADDIIAEPKLYDCFCECVRRLPLSGFDEEEISSAAKSVVGNASLPDKLNAEKLVLALLVMVSAYTAAKIRNISERYFEKLKEL